MVTCNLSAIDSERYKLIVTKPQLKRCDSGNSLYTNEPFLFREKRV